MKPLTTGEVIARKLYVKYLRGMEHFDESVHFLINEIVLAYTDKSVSYEEAQELYEDIKTMY